MLRRVEKARKLLDKNNVDAIVFKNEQTLIWLTGFENTHGYFVVTKNQVLFFVNKLFVETASKHIKHAKVLTIGALTKQNISIWDDIKTELKKYKITKLGFEGQGFNYFEFLDFKKNFSNYDIKEVDSQWIRMIKDENEMKSIQKACDINKRVFDKLVKWIKPGMTEKQVANWVDTQMLIEGSSKNSFDTIVASGENGSVPHAVPSDRKIKKGEWITLDFGGFYNKYCSDITRTFSIGKPKNKKLLEIYELVYKSNMAGIAAAKPGVSTKAVDAVCRKVIEDAGYGEYFCHGTGHGYGVEVHEAPRVSTYCDIPLEEGMPVTIEPGIYIPGLGGVRIEDDIVITKTGCKVLSKLPKKISEIII